MILCEVINISNISKSFGGRTLFNEVSFSINKGERIGLVGRNGDGKTTLFKIFLGQEQPDGGEISFPKGYRLGHLSQHLEFSHPTVREEALSGLVGDSQWTDGYKVEETLTGLGFTEKQLTGSPSDLSGGYQIRLNLARLIASAPDMLLLDEPTNYLDIVSLRWLKTFLENWKGELLLITHDHGFLDSVSNNILGIHRSKLRKIEGQTQKYYAQLELEEEVHEKSRVNQEKKIKEAEKFINTFRAKASKAKAVQSRVKALEKMDKVDALESIDTLEFKFSYTSFPGKRLLEAKDLSFGYEPGKELFKDLNLVVGAKDRIAVVGRNGKGKTTLLRNLVGELKPSAGGVELAPNMKAGYFGQTNVERLDVNRTIEEELLAIPGVDNRTHARSAAGLMMFRGDDALKKISVLSGGEKSRVLLAKIILSPANILFLDEPTNHLDLYSSKSLLEAVKDFPGAIVMVTHSELFLREIASRLVVFDSGKAEIFEGGYDDFLSRRGWSEEASLSSGEELKKKKTESSALGSKELRELKKQESRLEKKIEKAEELISKLNSELMEETKLGYGKKAEDLTKEISQKKKDLDQLYNELGEVMEKLS